MEHLHLRWHALVLGRRRKERFPDRFICSDRFGKLPVSDRPRRETYAVQSTMQMKGCALNLIYIDSHQRREKAHR